MAKNNTSTMEILKGISQAVANGHDGASYLIPGRSELKLKREEDNPINMSRELFDGFGARIHGNQLIVSYESEVPINDVHKDNFESEVEGMIGQIVKYLKKEYKRLTSKELKLTAVKDSMRTLVQTISRQRTWVIAKKVFKIGGLTDMDTVEDTKSKDSIDKKWKSFLDLSTKERPDNESIKKSDNKHEDIKITL